MKINIDRIKSFPNMLIFNLINLINFNAEFPTFMRFCLLQRYICKISGFLHPGKNQTLNGISDSTPRILTLGLPLQICYRRVGVLNLIIVDIGD